MFYETIMLDRERQIKFNISAQIAIDEADGFKGEKQSMYVVKMLTVGLKADDNSIDEGKVIELLDQYWGGSYAELQAKIEDANGKAFWGDKWEDKKIEIEEQQKKAVESLKSAGEQLLNALGSTCGNGISEQESAS